MACGKPVDAPDLELLSGHTSVGEGHDVAFPRGGTRVRSALAIGAVVAAMGVAAAFAGTDIKASSARTTVAASTTTTEATTTSTGAGVERSTTTVPLNVPMRLGGTLLEGETTGATLLLLGGPNDDGSLERSRILDIDRGVLTTLDDYYGPTQGTPITLSPTSQGLAALVLYGNNLELWQRDGSKSTIVGQESINRTQAFFAGDTVWATEFDPTGGSNQRLTSFTLRNGQHVVWLEDASQIGLIGVDAKGRPVVRGVDGGAYTFDPLTRQLNRLTSATVEAIAANGRVELECSDTMVCGEVFRNVDGTTQALGFPTAPLESTSLSPDGKHALKLSHGSGPEIFYDVADTATGAVVRLGFFIQDRYPAPTAAWTSDGRWLFVQLSTGLSAWRTGLEKPIPILVDGQPIQVLAVGVFPS
jgi:hypothetical protein